MLLNVWRTTGDLLAPLLNECLLPQWNRRERGRRRLPVREILPVAAMERLRIVSFDTMLPHLLDVPVHVRTTFSAVSSPGWLKSIRAVRPPVTLLESFKVILSIFSYVP